MLLGSILAGCELQGPVLPEDEVSVVTKASWRLGGTTYQQVVGFRTDASASATTLAATDAIPEGASTPINSWSVQFTKLPTTAGLYQVYPNDAVAPLAANQVVISASLGSSKKTYVATGKDDPAVVVQVKENAGKLTIVVPELTMQEVSDKTTLRLSGTLIEN